MRYALVGGGKWIWLMFLTNIRRAAVRQQLFMVKSGMNWLCGYWLSGCWLLLTFDVGLSLSKKFPGTQRVRDGLSGTVAIGIAISDQWSVLTASTAPPERTALSHLNPTTCLYF